MPIVRLFLFSLLSKTIQFGLWIRFIIFNVDENVEMELRIVPELSRLRLNAFTWNFSTFLVIKSENFSFAKWQLRWSRLSRLSNKIIYNFFTFDGRKNGRKIGHVSSGGISGSRFARERSSARDSCIA